MYISDDVATRASLVRTLFAVLDVDYPEQAVAELRSARNELHMLALQAGVKVTRETEDGALDKIVLPDVGAYDIDVWLLLVLWAFADVCLSSTETGHIDFKRAHEASGVLRRVADAIATKYGTGRGSTGLVANA